MMFRLLPVLLLVIVTACQGDSVDKDRVVVARAGDRVFYLDQLPEGLVAEGMEKADSISAVSSYIRRWARKELLALQAESNLTPEYKAKVNNHLREMRDVLLIDQYQQQMILQKLDTTVTDNELQDYYVNNLSTFTLNVHIVKALYIRVPLGMTEVDKIRRLYRSKEPSDMEELEEICIQYALRYDDWEDEWVPFTQLVMEVPLESDNQERWLARNSSVELRDDRFSYFIVIREYRLRNSVAPFDYIHEQVKTIILNKRRLDFLQKLEDDIYDEAINNNTLKLH